MRVGQTPRQCTSPLAIPQGSLVDRFVLRYESTPTDRGAINVGVASPPNSDDGPSAEAAARAGARGDSDR
jgi:hypothetical protein